MNKKLVVWIDDNLKTAKYSSELESYLRLMQSRVDLCAVDCIDDFAKALEDFASQGRPVDGIVVDLMLTVKQGHRRTFERLGVPSASIDAHHAGLQIIKILRMDMYRHPNGESPAAPFLETHRNSKIALLSTCYSASELDIFTAARAMPVLNDITRVYDILREKTQAMDRISEFLDSL